MYMARSLNRVWILIMNKQTQLQNHYRIVAVDDSYEDSGEVYVKIQMVGTNKIFARAVRELYQKEWLEQFSREDVAHLAALYTAEQTNNKEIIRYFPKRHHQIRSSVLIVSILFTGFLILSNLTAFKLAAIGGLIFPAGLMFFPLTYIFDDILTEVYGFKVSRRVIWSALLANVIVLLGTTISTYLPAAPHWHEQAAYAAVYHAVPRVFFASMIGYICGEFSNSTILAKLKILTAGRYLWFRALTSSAIGIGIDSILFIHIAFLFSVPYHMLWQIILTTYLVKLAYEGCAIPFTYKVTHYLKQKDNIDHYDFHTKFNPFSWAL